MSTQKRPNILIITTHDGGRHFGCYGAAAVHSPHIDALAGDGLLFEEMFATSPICSPSRGSLLTGRYPQSNGLIGIAGGKWNWEMNDYRQHLSWILRDAGYKTAMIGLQHETRHIKRLGFDDTSEHGVSEPGTADGLLPGWPAGKRGMSAPGIADRAVAYLRGAAAGADQPFYAQVGFFETHTPYDYAGCEPDDAAGVWSPPYADRKGVHEWASSLVRFESDRPSARRHLAALQGSIKTVDDAVGKITAALQDTGLEDNTLMLFNTDHGPELPGAKWTLYDPGLGVAFIVRWPAGGAIGGRRCPWLLSNVDFVPTLLDLIGAEPPANLQGVSFAPAIGSNVDNRPSPRSEIFGMWVDGLNFCTRTERYKLIRNLYPEVLSDGTALPSRELYDLQTDPLERKNLAQCPAQAELLGAMSAQLDAWLEDVDDASLGGLLCGDTLSDKVNDYRRRCEQPSID